MSNNQIRQCAVRVGKPGSDHRLDQGTRHLGADYVIPESYICMRCGQRWNTSDVGGYCELDTATCSNCYSERVYVIEVKLGRYEDS